MSEANGFTPAQGRLLAVLADGKPHPWEELWKALDDELAPKENIRAHLTAIRTKLRGRREHVVGSRMVGSNGVLRQHYVLVSLDPPA